MKDQNKTKKQLIQELGQFRQRAIELENQKAEHQQAEEKQERMLAVEREKRAMSEALHWAGAVLSSTLSFEKVLDHTMEQIGRVTPYSAACILLTEGKTARIFRWRGYTEFGTKKSLTSAPFNIADIPTLHTIQDTGWPLAIPFVPNHSEWVAKSGEKWIKSSVSVPIRTLNRLIGFLHVDSDIPGFYSQADAERLQAFANQAGIALENARRYDRARQEITKRVKALKKERNFVSAILDTTSALVVVLDPKGRIVRFNRACEHTTGYTSDEVRGKYLWDMFLISEEVKTVKSTFEQIRQGQYPVECECHWQTKDDQDRLIAWTNTALLDSKGIVEHIVGTGIDITKQRQSEKERDNLIEELETFAYTVAHDIQHTLGLSIGFADGLLHHFDTMPGDELKEHLHRIVRNNQKMSNIIDELLLLTGVRKQDVTPTPLDMASIVAEAQSRLAYMIEEYQPEITLPSNWPPALGHTPWIEEVWTNYFSNAIKYGGRPPQIELGATAQEDGIVCYWIRDNGPGLAPEKQTLLFKPFIRLDQVQVQGHGLGLSIVRRIVEKLNGQVGVQSQGIPGQGCVFSFTLPGVPEESHNP